MKAPGLGIDGCKYGWLAVECQPEGKLKHYLIKDLDLAEFNNYALIFIDMPIGLLSSGLTSAGDNGKRQCDMEARLALRPYRQHSVFLPPSREAIYSNDFNRANELNMSILGKKVSKQAYNLSEKMRSVDEQLINAPRLRKKLMEAHPEIQFWLLNKKTPMMHNKKTREGIRERLYVLQPHVPDISIWMDEVIFSTKRKHFQPDDLLDAAALAVGSYYSANNGMNTLPDKPYEDEYGIPMQMAMPAQFN